MLPAKLTVPPPFTSICPGWPPLVMVPVKVTVWPLGTLIVRCPDTVRLRAIVAPVVIDRVVFGAVMSVPLVAPRLLSPAICSVVPPLKMFVGPV